MRCPSCNKFATNGTDTEPEVDVDIDAEGHVTGSARIVITSECCGEELKEANFDIDIEADDELKAAIFAAIITQKDLPGELPRGADAIKLAEWELEAECAGAEITQRSQTESIRTKKDGTVVRKPIPYRYQKSFYGVSAQIEVTATKGDKTVTVALDPFEDEVPAGSMDELV